jgi:two-component system OmpR family response regulator
MRILVVEDNEELAGLIAEGLADADYETDRVATAADARHALTTARYSAVVLDLGLPDGDGLTVLGDVRARHNEVPILILTARASVHDRVAGLRAGADDYLTKPFASRELLARVKAILRRARALPANLKLSETARGLAFGDWLLDTTRRHLVDPAGTLVALSGAEYRLLRVFLDYPQRVLNRDQILNLTQGRETEPFDRSIDLLVSRLRQRLKDDAREPRYIKTVRNEGYVFASCIEVRNPTR